MLVAGGRDLSCERGIGVKHTNGSRMARPNTSGASEILRPRRQSRKQPHIGHDGVWPERHNSGMVVLDDAVEVDRVAAMDIETFNRMLVCA